MHALEVPKEALSVPDALEIFRGWLIGDDVVFVTRGDIWEDAGALGIVLADLLRHLIESSDAPEDQKTHRLKRALKSFAAEFEGTCME